MLARKMPFRTRKPLGSLVSLQHSVSTVLLQRPANDAEKVNPPLPARVKVSRNLPLLLGVQIACTPYVHTICPKCCQYRAKSHSMSGSKSEVTRLAETNRRSLAISRDNPGSILLLVLSVTQECDKLDHKFNLTCKTQAGRLFPGRERERPAVGGGGQAAPRSCPAHDSLQPIATPEGPRAASQGVLAFMMMFPKHRNDCDCGHFSAAAADPTPSPQP